MSTDADLLSIEASADELEEQAERNYQAARADDEAQYISKVLHAPESARVSKRVLLGIERRRKKAKALPMFDALLPMVRK